MTLLELKGIVDRTLNNRAGSETFEVVIPNNKGGWGGTSVTNVKAASSGFDWDNGLFIIVPENKLYEIKDKK